MTSPVVRDLPIARFETNDNMPRHLKTHALSLPELLRSRAAFVLPATQRAYGWGDQQLDRLFSDMGYLIGKTTANVAPPSWLFLGAVYLADQDDNTTAIADGQQRIVTGTMIYAAARDLETEDADLRRSYAGVVETDPDSVSLTPRLQLRATDADFFRKWVLERGATLRPFQNETDEGEEDASAPALSESQANILTNRGLIVEKLKSLDAAARRRLMAGIEDATELVVVTATHVTNALNAYASTYKRGLRQAETDRLKFEIIGDAPPERRNALADYWDECESKIGKDALEDLCGYLLQNKTGEAPPADVLTPLIDAFQLRTNADSFIVETLVPASNAYFQLISYGENLPNWLNTGLTEGRRARRIQGHVAALMRSTHHEWRGAGLAALLHLRGKTAALEKTLAKLERLVAVNMIVGPDQHALCRVYREVARAIESGNSEAISKALDVDQDMKARVRDQLASAKFGDKPRFRMPILMKLNDLAAGEVSPLTVTDATCEHVLPQSVGKNNPAWHTIFRNTSGKVYTGHHYRHRLGNMTILTHEENRAADDKSYELKRRIFANSQFALTQKMATRYDKWTPQTIEARTQDLIAQLVKHWDL
jgi:hypothetical protein